MYEEGIRRAVMAASRIALPDVAAAMWKAFGSGFITEDQAAELSALIEARKAVPVVTKAPPRRVGSRPRTDASLERRRRWAASGRLPPQIAMRFTTAEVAVLAVLAREVAQHGRCTLVQGHLAAVAGVSVSSVKRALRTARDLGLVEIEVRRICAFRNDANLVTVISREWLAWLRLARPGGGGQGRSSTNTQIPELPAQRAEKRLSEGGRHGPHAKKKHAAARL